ncbi:DUF1302 domain-containing protein [Uliginosibacterium sediminicola]|uniref:DUF1302 domain-containing protein n=1 Tax=Uliginosibacterium sediminicola TaxID=2024550 RepID=A0ABU9YX68_9RHOO
MVLALSLGLAIGRPALAFQFDFDDPDFKGAWDNTLKYNAAWRVAGRSNNLVSATPTGGNNNQDDGDRNFTKGLISNRINLLSELDLAYRKTGLRVSSAAWYDSVYNGKTGNNQASTLNQTSTAAGEFPTATRDLMGHHVELLDAFAYSSFGIGKESTATVRAGRHTQVWGESLFFGSNGMAGTMAPTDVQKLQAVPNTQFKEAMMPVNQLSGNLQLNSDVTLGAFYQLEWEPNRLAPSGSYFSTSDTTGAGAESLKAGPFRYDRTADVSARDQGQYGLQTKFHLPFSDADYGLYFVRYHDKSPQVVQSNFLTGPANGVLGTYALVYPEKVSAFGASASNTYGPVNLAGETSIRYNAPLVSAIPAVTGGAQSDNNNNPRYAVGKTAHANLSMIWSIAPNALFNESSLVAEVAGNRRLSIKQNAAALDPNTTRNAWGFRMVFTPTYRQVFDGLDLSFPIGTGYNPQGRSSAVSSFNNNFIDGGGDLSIGMTGSYLDAWRFSLNYTHYYGSKRGMFVVGQVPPPRTYDQSLGDRDFVAFSVYRTF